MLWSTILARNIGRSIKPLSLFHCPRTKALIRWFGRSLSSSLTYSYLSVYALRNLQVSNKNSVGVYVRFSTLMSVFIAQIVKSFVKAKNLYNLPF